MNETSAAVIDWLRGDLSGIRMPVHPGALRAGGADFLTRAFQASGALTADNRVTRVTRFEAWRGGSTGNKVLLSVAYENSNPALHTELFVKFSRDFEDPLRDQYRGQMESECRFGALSRASGFPIAVPVCYFADFHSESGSGILITQRIAFGVNGVERHYEKCLDYEIDGALEHYRALVTALARLAGSHRGGRLQGIVADQFPFDSSKMNVTDVAPFTERQLQNRISRLAEFICEFPELVPPSLRDPAFIPQFSRGAAQFAQHNGDIERCLRGQPDFIALCHWNANIDNAWFWRNESGALECGLLDWGHVSQMPVAMSLWGCLSAAELQIWERHLGELLTLFISEYKRSGGPSLDPDELKLHLSLHVAQMGLRWLLDVPAFVRLRVPDLAAAKNRLDTRIRLLEDVRSRLHMMTTFLSLWKLQDFSAALNQCLDQCLKGYASLLSQTTTALRNS